MTDSHQCFKPIPVLIGELNRQVKGWANYFSIGFPMTAYRQIECNISDGAASGLIDRRRGPPCISTSRLLGWRGWRRGRLRNCLRKPGSTRGRVGRAFCVASLLLYWLEGSVDSAGPVAEP